MRVVVTGATGHVGANLVRSLVARGDQVKVVVRSRTASLEGVDVERVTGDVAALPLFQRWQARLRLGPPDSPMP
jgi:uncharacterized protein YbjT (DUF2867 family)